MAPTFRSDLVCTREEQQGVVFYRVDDPRSETNFRLYEIEYLIAQKLDGARSLAEVIEAVKSEYSFDISEADLQRFVSQLEAMGFLTGDGAAAASPTNGLNAELTTAVDTVEGATQSRPPTSDLDLIPLEPQVDTAEVERLLRSALLHVKQGYIVHARDYFLAARELDTKDDRLLRIVSHLEIIGDSSGPAEVEYLWDQAQKLFPDLTAELGQVIDSKAAANNAEVAAGKPRRDTLRIEGEEDLRSRVMWSLLLLVILVGGLGVLAWVALRADIFAAPVPVRVATLEATRIPVFFKEPAAAVRPIREKWLEFAERGVVAELKVPTGTRVNQGDIIASLVLAPAAQKQLAAARTAVKKTEQQYEKVAKRLAGILAEREQVETERNAAADKLKELTPMQLLGKGGVSKRDIEKYKRQQVAANKKLTLIAKKERGPKMALEAVKKKLAAAQAKVTAIEKRVSGKLLRAPFTGTVVEVAAQPGQHLADKHKAVLLRDESEALITFDLAESVELQPGGQAFVAVDRGSPSRAKIAEVKRGEKNAKVEVSLADPTGAFGKMNPASFRLVREFVDPAFRVPASALLAADAGGTRVFIVSQAQAVQRDVEVLERDAASAVIRDATGALRNGEQLVVASVDSGDVERIVDGARLEVHEDRR